MNALIAIVVAVSIVFFGAMAFTITPGNVTVVSTAPAQPAEKSDYCFYAGGKVIGYGMTRAEIEAVLGAAGAEDTPVRGITRYPYVDVLYREDAAVLLQFTSDEPGNPWKTADGVGIGNSLAAIRQVYGLTDADMSGRYVTQMLTDEGGKLVPYTDPDKKYPFALSFTFDSGALIGFIFGDRTALTTYR